MFFKTAALTVSRNLQGKNCAGVFLIKLKASSMYLMKKETPTQVFPVDMQNFLRKQNTSG